MASKIEELRTFLAGTGDYDYTEEEIGEKITDEGDGRFTFEDEEYLVLTDEEADKAAREYIEDSIWAFRPEFILEHTNFYGDLSGRETADVIKAFGLIQERLSESANPLFKAMISDFDEFVEDAVDADGRGQFISWYDGKESESGDFYIYRTN